MILFRADANTSIGMGHIMRCLSIADALASLPTSSIINRGKDSIKFVLADETVADLIRSRGYEPIVLHTDYSDMDSEISPWTELADSLDADLVIVDSYYVTSSYLSWLRDNIGTVCYIDDVLAFPYPVDILVNYNAYANLRSYQKLNSTSDHEMPHFILGPSYAPLRDMFRAIPKREQREDVTDILLSTGGSDELHVALNLIKYICDHPQNSGSGLVYHLLLGAMNTDKDQIKSIAEQMDNIVIHENVADMKFLISSMDIIQAESESWCI